MKKSLIILGLLTSLGCQVQIPDVHKTYVIPKEEKTLTEKNDEQRDKYEQFKKKTVLIDTIIFNVPPSWSYDDKRIQVSETLTRMLHAESNEKYGSEKISLNLFAMQWFDSQENFAFIAALTTKNLIVDNSYFKISEYLASTTRSYIDNYVSLRFNVAINDIGYVLSCNGDKTQKIVEEQCEKIISSIQVIPVEIEQDSLYAQEDF